MTTALGLNDKFLIYPSETRIEFYSKEFWIFACYKEKKKELFMILIGSKTFPPVLYFLCQKAQSKTGALS